MKKIIRSISRYLNNLSMGAKAFFYILAANIIFLLIAWLIIRIFP